MYPKSSRADDADRRNDRDEEIAGNRSGGDHVFSRGNGGHRRVSTNTISWRYHPRPRGLQRPPQPHGAGGDGDHDDENDDNGDGDAAAAAAAATVSAAAVPPPLLTPKDGSKDLLLLATGVKSSSSGVDRCTRRRSVSDSEAPLLLPSPSPLARETCKPEQLPHHRHHVLQHQQQRAQTQDLPPVTGEQNFNRPTTESVGDGDDDTYSDGMEEDDSAGWSDVIKSSGMFDQERGPAASTPTQKNGEAEKGVQFFPLRLRLGYRRRIRLREETCPIFDEQDPMTPLSQPQSPSAGVTVPLPSTKAYHSLKKKLGLSFRRGRRSSESPRATVRRTVGGKALAVAALAYGALWEPTQGKINHSSRVSVSRNVSTIQVQDMNNSYVGTFWKGFSR